MKVQLVDELPKKQFEWRNDPSIMRYCRQNKVLTWKDQMEWEAWIRTDQSVRMFGVYVPGYDRIVGTCGLTSIRMDHKTAEYSMLIGPPYQGKGFATEGMKELIAYGFEKLNLDLIWGEIYGYNHAGQKIAKNVGFTKEADLRSRYFKEGKRIDTVIVSLLREEWKALLQD